jgi:hypothetical protein
MPLKIDDVKVPAVQRDNPTRPVPPAAPANDASAAPAKPTLATTKRKRTAKPASVDEALADTPKAITNRVPGALWDQLVARATELNIPIRLLLTDAIVQAVELDTDEHGRRARRTLRREQLAKLPPEE